MTSHVTATAKKRLNVSRLINLNDEPCQVPPPSDDDAQPDSAPFTLEQLIAANRMFASFGEPSMLVQIQPRDLLHCANCDAQTYHVMTGQMDYVCDVIRRVGIWFANLTQEHTCPRRKAA